MLGALASPLIIVALALAGASAGAQSGVVVYNQQSYSEAGQEWRVRFSAPAGSLSVSGAGDTQLGRDVSFLRLAGLSPSDEGGKLTFSWGGGAGELAVTVLAEGSQQLLLESSGSGARAHNEAYPRTSHKIGGGQGGPQVSASDQFGSAVASVGDVDGDGVPDLAVGSPFRSSQRGGVQVVMLNPDGSPKSSASVSVAGVAAGHQFGRAVAGIGDVDGDGVPDLAVGSPNKSSQHGEAQVVLLNRDGTYKGTGGAIAAPARENIGMLFGFSAAGIGDVNGDGVPDLAVGAPRAGTGTGRVYVLMLTAAGAVNEAIAVENPAPGAATTPDNFGSSVAGIGDVDGDGVPDIAAGSPNRASSTGAAWVVLLRADGSAKRAVALEPGGALESGGRFGSSAAGVGDVDRDGVPDVAVGSSAASGGGTSRGAVHVITLTEGGGTKQSFRMDGESPNASPTADYDQFGIAVAGLGDLDRDGAAELAVGASGDDGAATNGGAVHVIRLRLAAPAGSGELLPTGAALHGDTEQMPAAASGDRLGYSAASIGDVNGDGVPDIAVGARGDDSGGGQRGAVYVVMMAPDGQVDEVSKISSGSAGGPALADGDGFGSGVAGIGDADSDGVPDIAVGARGSGGAGALYLLLLNADGTAKSAQKIDGSTDNGPQLASGDLFGESVSSADLDGDGTRDIAVGAPGHADTGAVHVLFMDSDRSVKSSIRIDGSTANVSGVRQFDWFGKSVAFADIDSDGTPDLAVGNTANDSGSGRNNDRGALHVLFMNQDGSVKSSRTIDSATAGGPALSAQDEFGSSVSGAGDADSDGVPDLVAGAWNDDAGGDNAGALHLLLMKSDGLPKATVEIGASAAGRDAGDRFGSAAASADINGDGSSDLLAGASGAGGRGELDVLFMSGTSVRSVAALSGSEAALPLSAGDLFGSSVAGIGDLDRDGVPDLAVGAENDDTGGRDRGSVHVFFMNRGGEPDRRVELNAGTLRTPPLQLGARFGASVAGIGDLDGDGVPDIAAGSPSADGGFGHVRIMQMNRDGSAKASTVVGFGSDGILLNSADGFGSSVAGIGDIDGDGVPDVAVGAPLLDGAVGRTTGADRGAAFVLLMGYGADGPSWDVLDVPGSLDFSLQAGDMLGASVAGIGDIDGNGVPDVAVGAPGDDGRGASDAQRGAVHVLLMSRTGVLSNHKVGDGVGGGPALSGDAGFGASVAGIGDMDGDGVPDVSVGAPLAGSAGGSGWVLLMKPDGTAKRAVEFGALPGASAGDHSGSSVALLGDLDRDGAAEMAVGAPGYDDEGNDNKGAVRTASVFRPAVVAGVDSPAADGAYGIGAELDVAVAFFEPVSVTGTPSIYLETGAPDASAPYESGSGTDELIFRYEVREGDFADDLGYVSVSSLTDSGGAVQWSGRPASLALQRPGTLDSLSFSRQLYIDGIRPSLDGPIELDLSAGSLSLEFDEAVAASEIRAGGIAVHSGGQRIDLSGAQLPASDTSSPALRLTGEQTRGIVEAYLAARPLLVDISGTAFQDAVGNHFAGISDGSVQVSLSLGSDTATASDSARAYKSGFVPSDEASASDSASALGSYLRPAHDSPAVSDSLHGTGAFVRMSSDTATASDSARSYKSGFPASDSPTASDSARSYKSGFPASDSPATSDSARSYKSGLPTSDSPAASDSVRTYLSGFAFSDSPALSDSAATLSASVRLSSDTAAFSDSARSYQSGLAVSDSPPLSDSVGLRGDSVRAASDTAAFSDSARSYQSGLAVSDSPALSDSAATLSASVRLSSDTAAFSDSARAYQSGYALSDSPSYSDSASFAGVFVQGATDALPVSDSARAYHSAMSVSDSPAVSDRASASGAFSGMPSDQAQVSDSARSYKSAAAPSGAPALSDAAQWGSMRAASGSDSPAAGDSARAYKSAAAAGSLPEHSGGARAGKAATSVHDAPRISDAARTGLLPADAHDAPVVSDGARFSIAAPEPEPRAGSRAGAPVPRGGSGPVGAPVAAVHGASWDRCSASPHVLVVAGPDCELVSVTVSNMGRAALAENTGAAGGPPDSCVWRASVNPEAREAQLRAVHRGSNAADVQDLSMDGCSGWAPFNAFAARSGPPTPERGEDPAPREAQDPHGEPDAQGPQDVLEPAPESERLEEPAPAEPAADLPAADLPAADLPAADLPAADLPADEDLAADLPAADELAAREPATDFLKEPEAEPEPQDAGALAWAGAAAAGAAAAAGLALALRKRSA